MERILFIAKRTAIAALIFLAVIYAGDYASVRVRMMHPKTGDPLEDVTLRRYYAVSEKGQKLEYMPADPQTVTCVHSLFPHLGYNPCWYVNRLNNQPIPMTVITFRSR